MEGNNTIWIIIRRMRMPFLVIIVTFAVSILGLTLIPGIDDQGKPYHMGFFDAFYFVSYMASTIGFGEAPYSFTYPQRLWVSFCIYLTVIGWFYGIGTIIALIQDQKLARELSIARFRNKISKISEPFIIILGYNNVTHKIIDWLNRAAIRVVVIDKNNEKINTLELENFIPEVPALTADVTQPEVLKLAGIHKKNCEGVISLFDNDLKNTKIALMCRLLNKHLKLVIKSTTPSQTEHLHNLGIRYIEDPFRFISNRFHLALTSTDLWLLEMWIFGHILKIRDREILPKGNYILCGYGRMGQALGESLEKADIPYTYIDLKSSDYKSKKQSAIFGDAEDHDILLQAGVKKASVIIAATKDDLINLTILSTAKKFNKHIYTIARENTLDDLSIFKSARINRIYILEQILSEFTYLFIARPLAYKFVRLIHSQNNMWGKTLIERMQKKIGDNPKHFEITVSEEQTYALYQELKKGTMITLETLKRSRENYQKPLKLIFLLAIDGASVNLLPEDNLVLKPGMQFLIASTSEAKTDFEYITNNYYELYYAMTGKEKEFVLSRMMQ
ncbi:portal protein [Sulfurovum lithotrophicum]|uniref:Portal protein n=1 Tax=Sulfurovum lithotrophicum TaxID=206403 RepID=A0A7U4RQP1_9BACT|nr:NAD(P)-binding protein [Sulfurovum lithotrophicum]AKF25020.1 portal protein [Sulfurovum lithotrophicum]